MPVSAPLTFSFDNTFARQMAGFYTVQGPAPAPRPQLVLFNPPLAERLGFPPALPDVAAAAEVFSGHRLPAGAEPLAQVYAGHQFGSFVPRLGDGRALLIGEVVAPDGARFDLQLKGAGPTPYSRGGDGLSALGPALREFLISEAMAALGIPTTRALAVVTTGSPVFRDGIHAGAVLTRIAASHIRIGTFQYFAARGEEERVRQLADYCIARHYPHIGGRERYLDFFGAVLAAQARLIARWMSVGFVHGVMNTDNTTICGETIDYGPCAFLDTYDRRKVFSSIDEQGRYAFGNQPVIAQWNLARLGETLIGLIDPDEARAIDRLTEVLGTFPALYEQHWLDGMRAKLGLATERAGDADLVLALLTRMETGRVDFTGAFRALADVVRGQEVGFAALFGGPGAIDGWLDDYRRRLAQEGGDAAARAAAMDRVNPVYIPRNHLVEAAIRAAVETGDLAPFRRLFTVLSAPFTDQPGAEECARPSPGHDREFRTFCGT